MKRIKKFLPIFLALVMCVTSIQPVLATESTNDSNVSISESLNVATFQTVNGFVEFEAENATLNTSLVALLDADTEPAKAASGGAAVQVTNNGGYSSDSNVPPSATSGIQFKITPDKKAHYYIWVRCICRNTSQDNVWISLSDSTDYKRINIMSSNNNTSFSGSTTDYIWLRLNNSAAWKNKNDVTVGENFTVRFIPSDVSDVDGFNTIYDKFIVTTDYNYNPNVAQIGDKNYATLHGAITAANSGDTITLLKDITSEDAISLSKGILDLNGKTLTAPSLTAFSGTDVVDSSEDKKGLLEVDDFKPDDDNDQMPIYNGEGYVFIDFEDIVIKGKAGVESDDAFKLVFKPSFGATNTAFGSLGDGADVSFRIRLKWTDASAGEQTKDLYWSSDLIKQVYGNSMAFSVTASGVSKYEGLTITPLVQSTLNPEIEWLGTEYSVNPVNK